MRLIDRLNGILRTRTDSMVPLLFLDEADLRRNALRDLWRDVLGVVVESEP